MSGARVLVVVFGAAVRADGKASAALARRVGYAAAAAENDPAIDLFCSGGQGRHGRPEATVMATLLAGHVDRARVHLDFGSLDTLQTVRAAAAFYRTGGYAACLAATDSWHQPRVRMLFALYGIRCGAVPMVSRGAGRLVWRMRLREAAAFPYDLVAGLWSRWR